MNEQTRALLTSILALTPDQFGALLDALHEADQEAFGAELERRHNEAVEGKGGLIPWAQLRDEM